MKSARGPRVESHGLPSRMCRARTYLDPIVLLPPKTHFPELSLSDGIAEYVVAKFGVLIAPIRPMVMSTPPTATGRLFSVLPHPDSRRRRDVEISHIILGRLRRRAPSGGHGGHVAGPAVPGTAAAGRRILGHLLLMLPAAAGRCPCLVGGKII